MRLILILVGCLAGTAQAVSFDCAKAQTKVEHLICDNPDISNLDEALASKYLDALQATLDAEKIKEQQKRWLKQRNACSTAECVKAEYGTRLLELSNQSPTAPTDKVERNFKNGSCKTHKYCFAITKGAGTPVCDAYLLRLNSTVFEKPPYCGIPENTSIAEFTKLTRKPLSNDVLNELLPVISVFMGNASMPGQLAWWSDPNNQLRLIREHKGTPEQLGAWLQNNSEWAGAWRYDPRVDIDNDGTLDEIQLWEGQLLPTGYGGTACGEHRLTHPEDPPIRQPRIAFIIDSKTGLLDAQKTVQVFGHPRGGYPIAYQGKITVADRFRPIGTSIGIFEYRGIYYFDTFFDDWGDFDGKRVNGKNIENTLGVFLSNDGARREVCEYLMTNNTKLTVGDMK